jgi:hypothetical protein
MNRSLVFLALLSLSFQAGAQVDKAALSTSSAERTPEEWKAFAAAKRAAAVAPLRGPAPLAPEAQARQDELGKRLAPGMTLAIRNASLMREASGMCGRTQPASRLRFEKAQQAWESRNAPVLKRAYDILAKYFPHSDRKQLNAMALKESYETLNEVARTSPAARVQWCEQMAGSMASGSADLARTGQVAAMMRLTD